MSKQETNPVWMKKYNMFFTVLIVGLLTYWGIKGLKASPTELEQNLPLRKQMISFVTEFRLALGDRVFQQALLCDDGWLEFTGEGYLDDYQNVDSLTPGRLEKIHVLLQSLNSELSARQITLLVVVAPNKGTIYPEKIPNEIQKIQQGSRLDTLLSYVDRHGPQVFIDLRPVLLNAKKNQQIYYQTDTHWNAIGAYYAYRGILDALSGRHPELHAIELSNFTQVAGDPIQRDISKLMESTTILESSPQLSPTFVVNTQWTTLNTDIIPASLAMQSDANLPSAIIYQDSFGEGLKPYLSLHFEKSIFISRSSQQDDFFSYTFIDQFDPDIVIIEIVERDLPALQFLLNKFNQSK